MNKYYINLTNGIEAMTETDYKDIISIDGWRFIRIQSTICEQKNWDRLIQELDYDFLLNLAIGNRCCIFDYGARKEIPRALYQGVEFIKYALDKRWFNKEISCNITRSKNVIGANCDKYFKECYDKLDDRTKKKLDYFKPFLNERNEVNITCISKSTNHDNDKKYYSNILKKGV